MLVAETGRIFLRHLNEGDAPFILRLLNEPSFHRFVGDRGVRSIEQARNYIVEGPVASYRQHGYGLYLVGGHTDAGQERAMGICGLVRRPTLEQADLGFAFVPEFWGSGYAFEAAQATLALAESLGLDPVLAITSPDNERSISLLLKLGFRFDRLLQLAAGEEEVKLFVVSPGAQA